MSEKTAKSLAALDALLPLLTALPAGADRESVVEETEALRRAVAAFHMEAIRFRMVLGRSRLETHAGVRRWTRPLRAAAFGARSRRIPHALARRAVIAKTGCGGYLGYGGCIGATGTRVRRVPRSIRSHQVRQVRQVRQVHRVLRGRMTSARRARLVLADLDDTLFDHAGATRSALTALCGVEPAFGAWPFAELEVRHAEVLERLHREVLDGLRTIDAARIARFAHLLNAAGADHVESRAHEAAVFYRSAYQRTWGAVAGAIALLEALRAAGVPVTIVTNNGTSEQRGKLTGCGLADLIHALVTSEDVGVSKPDVRIFEHALALTATPADDAVMFGDAWATDIVGARQAGIRAVWFNRSGAESPSADVAEVRALLPTDELMRDAARIAVSGDPECWVPRRAWRPWPTRRTRRA